MVVTLSMWRHLNHRLYLEIRNNIKDYSFVKKASSFAGFFVGADTRQSEKAVGYIRSLWGQGKRPDNVMDNRIIRGVQ